ncbi:CND2-like protein [Mya arenaria]|uniref:Condensin complex subunit 2 n=1 Tax=Mya arenaria TaxID=6604 RepID=A0ABY7FHB6_MYAAR|nr:CND2-like protein [Mya arenaria]
MSAMRQREVLSPIVTTPNIPHRQNSQSSVHSPSIAKFSSVSSPSTLLMEQQDDEQERKARRRSRVMDLQRKNMGSPSSPADRRKSLPLQNFTTAQLTEHYTSCIKLSAENVASTTLDASAKIYAGRVDAIHAETFKVDPLFQVMSAAFDEGGSSGLLLSNLRTFDNTLRLVLDSNTLVAPTDDLDTSRIEERRENVDVSDFPGLHHNEQMSPLQVCPAFSTYRFTNWDSSDQEHRFDMDAEPEPIPEGDDDNMSIFGGGDGIMDDVEDVADTNLDEDMGTDNCIGDGKAAKLVQSVLSTEPSDYSYFNKALLRSWAGPAHWKAGHLSKESWKSTVLSKKDKTKGKKTVFRIDFDEEIDFDSKFKLSKGTALTKNTLNKYSKDQTTLPKDHHYDADKLFRLFLLRKKMIRRQKSSADVDDAIENYDYENINDRENYCPNDENVDDDNDSGDVDFGNFVAAGTDFNSESSSSQDPFSQSQDTFTQANPGDGTLLTGNTLLAQPYKVAKIDIDYAKTAKKLDVKRLKSSMWHLLKASPKTSDQPQGTEEGNENNSASVEPSPGPSSENKEMQGQTTFQKLLDDLPEKVSGQTAKNLSVPIAFVCLLHLANEKRPKHT